MFQTVHFIDPLIHDVYNMHSSSIAENQMQRNRYEIAEKSMPLIQVVHEESVDEQFCVGRYRSTRLLGFLKMKEGSVGT